MRAILLAAFMTTVNWNEYGMVAFALWLFTGWVCIYYDLRVRYFMYGFYIVFGFWYGLAGSMS